MKIQKIFQKNKYFCIYACMRERVNRYIKLVYNKIKKKYIN